MATYWRVRISTDGVNFGNWSTYTIGTSFSWKKAAEFQFFSDYPSFVGSFEITSYLKYGGSARFDVMLPGDVLRLDREETVYPGWNCTSTVFISATRPCQDQRTYSDTYRITIQGTSKLGNPVSIVQDYNFTGGGEFWLEDHEANLKGWYSIERVAIRALGQNVTSKNGVIQLIVREYVVPVTYEGAALGASGGFSEDVTFATAVFRSCQLYADISTTGFTVRNRYLSFCSSLAVSVTGFLDSGVVCCDDDNDDSEKSGGGDRPLPPADCDCVALQVQIQNLYKLVLELSQGGTQGPPGPQGIEGPQGIQGPKGDKGDKGDTGDIGSKGDKGDKGDTGATGPQGPQGPQGIQGQQGPQGIQGQAGEDGINGADGWISEVEYMAIEDKLQGILDSLKCADRTIACILEKGLIFDKSTPSGDFERGLVEVVDQGLIKIVDHPEAGELEMSLIDSVVDFEGKTVQQSIEEIEGVTIENEFRVQSRRTEEIPEEV